MEKRQTIICIVGESGTGKTYIANHLEDAYGIPMIESRTTRPRRTPDERGHLFVSDEEFDTYKKEDMLAYTKFGDYRYCCLSEDVTADLTSYVIDEDGLRYLRDVFSSRYNIFSTRIFSYDHEREHHVSKERMERDKGRFTMGYEEFDYILHNQYITEDTQRKVAKMLLRVSQKFD